MLQSSRKYLAENHHKLLQFNSLAESFSRDLLGEVDLITIIARAKQKQKNKEILGQFLTPASVAELMAGMFEKLDYPQISLLDAGAGSGSLLAAFVAKLCHQQQHPTNLDIVAYEIDPFMIKYLRQTLKLCASECQLAGISFNYEIRERDFIEDAVTIVNDNSIFTHAILNPPYLKIKANSKARTLLRSLGLETSNLYTGFIAATAHLLKSGGEFVAISPRSFCNGLYFRDFRKMFLEMMALRQIHLFESRQKAFSDDEVLQETVIIHATKQKQKFDNVLISTSSSADDDFVMSNSLSYTEIVHPNDSEQFIHIIPDNFSQQVVQQIANFTCTLKDLGLTVSTGRVVDFRAKEYLRYYGKTYKPNTRETVRRQTVHQFLDAALIVANPDNPGHPINSPKTVYQIEESVLELLRTYKTPEWEKSIRTYLASVETLKKRYAQERELSRIPVTIEGEVKTLSPGGQNILIEKIINEFAPRFTPGGKLVYVGDTDEKFAHFNEAALLDLGVSVDSHGKMPDVIIHHLKKKLVSFN